jgi:hypothetical protein
VRKQQLTDLMLETKTYPKAKERRAEEERRERERQRANFDVEQFIARLVNALQSACLSF